MLTIGGRPRLTYANVMSTVALFVALGGASYAARGALGPDSVGTRQLRAAAVTPPKLAFGYQSGVVSRSNRRLSISYSCPKRAVKCPPPAGDTRIAAASVKLTRPATLLINASNLVTNRLSAPVVMFIQDTIQGAPLEEACSSQTVIPAKSTETVSCTGATGALRAGKYRIDILESALGVRSARVSTEATQSDLVWWTLPPSAHRR